jgi:hypothetical protein
MERTRSETLKLFVVSDVGRSIKGKVKKKYFATAGCFLAFQPE